jgi:hypothetical protein
MRPMAIHPPGPQPPFQSYITGTTSDRQPQ